MPEPSSFNDDDDEQEEGVARAALDRRHVRVARSLTVDIFLSELSTTGDPLVLESLWSGFFFPEKRRKLG